VYLYSKLKYQIPYEKQFWDKKEIAYTQGITSVSFFNPYHLSCHIDATRKEREKKQPMKEWKAAEKRNEMAEVSNFTIQ